ncbi:GGDEF domain-containing protein [Marinagarivorans cellulosilyticus]|uniref:diguanylate cyclase n=1 Tax=Marinagarivorans cellulosilyticus TaxID=2721545 RepID=A0AAN2BJE1_9GAMM|nr:GGDEF domain-containing protein [Marinagarivorans cellulosilyticus]BCD96915.1 two-component system, chemotaxis family, response regulator WspR [Marinagarivorans cellulosilyticus]
MPESPSEPSNISTLEQTDTDIYRRSLPMLPVFSLLWLAIIWASGFNQTMPKISFISLVGLAGIFGLQCLFALVQKRLYRVSAVSWRFLFYLFAFASAVIWSALFTLCFFEPSFERLFLPMTLATAGITNAALSNFAPSRWVAQSYVSVLLLPAVFVCFSSQAHITMGGVVVVYWFFSLLILQRFHSEYSSGFVKASSFEQQHTELQRENRTDGLTKVFNRRYFDEALKKEWQQGAQEGAWLGLLFIDIDFFKKINDTYGHMAGDECLKQAAAIINGAVQSGNDIVARYGGEEFAVLLPRTAPDMAQRIAESIRKQFELKEFCFDDRCISITASIGVSSIVPSIANPPTILIDQADQGVYLAKEAGRNNVQLFGSTT